MVKVYDNNTAWVNLINSSIDIPGFAGARSGSATNNTTAGKTTISIPKRIFSDQMSGGQTEARLVFTTYRNANMFPLKRNENRNSRFQISTAVIGASIAGQSVDQTAENITISIEFNQVQQL